VTHSQITINSLSFDVYLFEVAFFRLTDNNERDASRGEKSTQNNHTARLAKRKKITISHFISQLTIRAKRYVIAERGYIDGKLK